MNTNTASRLLYEPTVSEALQLEAAQVTVRQHDVFETVLHAGLDLLHDRVLRQAVSAALLYCNPTRMDPRFEERLVDFALRDLVTRLLVGRIRLDFSRGIEPAIERMTHAALRAMVVCTHRRVRRRPSQAGERLLAELLLRDREMALRQEWPEQFRRSILRAASAEDREILETYYRFLERSTALDAARELGLSLRAFYNRLERSQWCAVRRAERQLLSGRGPYLPNCLEYFRERLGATVGVHVPRQTVAARSNEELFELRTASLDRSETDQPDSLGYLSWIRENGSSHLTLTFQSRRNNLQPDGLDPVPGRFRSRGGLVTLVWFVQNDRFTQFDFVLDHSPDGNLRGEVSRFGFLPPFSSVRLVWRSF